MRNRQVPETLIGIAEIAQILGVSRQRAHQIADKRTFPLPVQRLAMGPVWTRAQLDEYLKAKAS